MAKLKYTVEMEDETIYEVMADQRDIAKAEVSEVGQEVDVQSTVTGSRYIAYLALHRTGKLPKEINTWEKFNKLAVETTFEVMATPKAGNQAQSATT